MNMATLALCIPAYNAAGFLGRLLKSARLQTVPFDEILVYDDASSDNTADLARQLGAVVVRGEINKGCSHGKNVLAARSVCDWLHFHDADDALEPIFVESARRWMTKNNPPDVVFFSYHSVEDGTGRWLADRVFDGNALRTDPIAYCLAEQINPFCGIYRREAFLRVGGWDEDLRVLQSEDQAGHLRMALAGLKFDADPAFTVTNFVRAGSMTTSNIPGAQRSTYHVLAKGAEATPRDYHEIIARRLWITAGFSAAYKDWENADRAAALARRIAPHMRAPGGVLMRLCARRFPRSTLRVREFLIRLLRPHERASALYHCVRDFPADT
ncbi:MAG: glycosyltransferase family A protein [Nibricoccus sp.]